MGRGVGGRVGAGDGIGVGTSVGSGVGLRVGSGVGAGDGTEVGSSDGSGLGTGVGRRELTTVATDCGSTTAPGISAATAAANSGDARPVERLAPNSEGLLVPTPTSARGTSMAKLTDQA